MFLQACRRTYNRVTGQPRWREYVIKDAIRAPRPQAPLPSMLTHRLPRVALGLLLSAGISTLAYRRRSLDRSGVAGAVITGTSTFGLGGNSWGLSLIFFFVSSSLFSHFRAQEKAATAADKFSKGTQRDFAQVMANGGVASLLASAHALSSNAQASQALHAGYIGALATANADTWATELGVLSPHAPRLITNGRVTTPGTSGGITPLGTTASAAGALSLGLFNWLMQPRDRFARRLPLIALLSGLTGSLFDSLLGATVQAMYYCPQCAKETERRVHNCGTPTLFLRGSRHINNDTVNFLATLCGSIVAIFLARGTSRTH
ncbi:hypothetical protein KSC_053320 [Ktedonobacter sp. SOSP1-52]|uniref:DUF92 domain-containing protein n=1 Tax=Ktedonobacter sp. SOSP1-52 TaxID=2778366 RepID=UPI001914DD92|nr:DUF92 domain-containing protein [Ktedonobacter sp. SOSP1-52]GHO66440.1 hypothetical protein KSC_053320 [Ktedonobacter sp. SOSP1-52]